VFVTPLKKGISNDKGILNGLAALILKKGVDKQKPNSLHSLSFFSFEKLMNKFNALK